jgi:hypothetical protein
MVVSQPIVVGGRATRRTNFAGCAAAFWAL